MSSVQQTSNPSDLKKDAADAVVKFAKAAPVLAFAAWPLMLMCDWFGPLPLVHFSYGGTLGLLLLILLIIQLVQFVRTTQTGGWYYAMLRLALFVVGPTLLAGYLVHTFV